MKTPHLFERHQPNSCSLAAVNEKLVHVFQKELLFSKTVGQMKEMHELIQPIIRHLQNWH